MKNKIWLAAAIVFFIVIAGAGVFFWLRRSQMPAQPPAVGQKSQTQDLAIEYWTCSMHPQVHQDGPGKCPICGMALIPLYKKDAGKIVVDESTRKNLGLISNPAIFRHFVKTLRLPALVSHDYELYVLEQEYLSTWDTFTKFKDSAEEEVLKRQESLLEAVRLRLKFLGFGPPQIKELEASGKPDESLIYPSEGRVWVHADVYEADLGVVKAGGKVKVSVEGYPQSEFSGEIIAIAEVLNPQTRSAKARIKIADPDNQLKHEVYADLSLAIDLGQRLGIPQSSLIDTGTRKIVYLDLGNGRYQPRQVKTGVEAGGYVEVLEGIQENEAVVTEGNFLLDSQSTLTGGQSLLYGTAEEVKEKKPAQAPQHKH